MMNRPAKTQIQNIFVLSSPKLKRIQLHSLFFIAIAIGASLASSPDAKAQSLIDEETSSDTHFTLGGVVAYAPRYEGSDEYKMRALPLINYRNGRFFAGALGGIGYNVSPVTGLEFGPLLSYRFGRRESEAARLRGLGNVDSGADIGAFVRWNLRPFFVHGTVKQGVGGGVTGTQINLGVGYLAKLGSSDRLVFDASLDWADNEVMQAYFGVTPTQSANSGLAVYRAGNGIRRYGVSALWTHVITPQWFSTVAVGAYRLGDQAANSPITIDRTAGTVSAGIGYRF